LRYVERAGYHAVTATGLIGGALGILAGVSLMAVRELGRQQKRNQADQHDSREE
ncbi:hydrogenase 2 small subunit, partial [Edwardsiella tarda]